MHHKLFLSNTKFLFWTSFRMLCHGDIFLLSQQKCNLLSKKNKQTFIFMWHKKISFVFNASQIFYIDFTLHVASMLIFFVLVLKTKKLWINFYSPVSYTEPVTK